MNHQCVFSLAVLISVSPARADWVIVQEAVQGDSTRMARTNRLTIKMKANKTRIDTGLFQSIITDGDSGDQTVLFHPSKRYTVRSASERKEGMELTLKMRPQPGQTWTNRPKLQATGRHQNINGYDTEEFVWESPKIKGSYWVAKDFPNAAALRDAMENAFAEGKKMAMYPTPETRELPGFTIRSEQEHLIEPPAGLSPEQLAKMGGLPQNQKATHVLTLISAKEEALSDSEFTVPPGYTDVASSIPRTNSTAGLRQVLKEMEKKGLSEADRRSLEAFIKNAEGQRPKTEKDGSPSDPSR